MKTIRRLPHSLLRLQARLFLAAQTLLLLATQDIAAAQSLSGNFSAVSGDLNVNDRVLLRAKKVYVTAFQDDIVQVFSLRGSDLGVFANVPGPTGLVFDGVGNLFVAGGRRPNYAIQKYLPDGTGSTFADSSSGLDGPHGLVFDEAGNLYVANLSGNTVEKFTPDGTGTIFAGAADGLDSPVDLAFDTAGNLYVSNFDGGPTHAG